jgi:ABC-2 type transport system permease protein
VLVFALGLPLVSLIIKDPVNPGIFALLSLATLLVQLFFIGIGIFLAALLNKIKQVTPIALGVVFFFFIIELVNQSIQEKGLTFLTPFSYFKGSYIVAHRCYDSTYLFVDLAVFILLTLAGAWLYQKRDMHAA